MRASGPGQTLLHAETGGSWPTPEISLFALYAPETVRKSIRTVRRRPVQFGGIELASGHPGPSQALAIIGDEGRE